METRDIVFRLIYADDPALARRILALLGSYERGQLRHQLLYQPLRRRHPERERVPTLTDVNKPAA
jgi:hypothetical protein